jgi:hypothetical protein
LGFVCLGVLVTLRAVSVPGTVKVGNTTCPATFKFDSGADQTIISRACAQTLGLLDANGDAPANTATKDFNKGLYDLVLPQRGG